MSNSANQFSVEFILGQGVLLRCNWPLPCFWVFCGGSVGGVVGFVLYFK